MLRRCVWVVSEDLVKLAAPMVRRLLRMVTCGGRGIAQEQSIPTQRQSFQAGIANWIPAQSGGATSLLPAMEFGKREMNRARRSPRFVRIRVSVFPYEGICIYNSTDRNTVHHMSGCYIHETVPILTETVASVHHGLFMFNFYIYFLNRKYLILIQQKEKSFASRSLLSRAYPPQSQAETLPATLSALLPSPHHSTPSCLGWVGSSSLACTSSSLSNTVPCTAQDPVPLVRGCLNIPSRLAVLGIVSVLFGFNFLVSRY